MSKTRIARPLIALFAAMTMSMAAFAVTPAQACGSYTPSESQQARWAVHSHLAEHSGSIKQVKVQLAGKRNAAAVVQFKDKAKLPPLLLRLVKSKGSWKVVSKSWS